ncbi:hypothetical protein L593_13660 [Salinarchaeum sp. Harcht-Bsk1]|nr:hypothetical protein L593_13660 [Salinarchaeum sp. Harcht-Bsk1]
MPEPGDVSERFWNEFPEMARMPLSHQHERGLRPELLDRDTSEEFVEPMVEDLPDGANLDSLDDKPEDWTSGFDVEQEDGRNPVMWGEAVVRLLQSHEDCRNTTLHLERGYPGDPGHATHDVEADNRWMPSYQKKKFAEMNGWFREVVGVGERPSGESPDGIMEHPNVVLLTRSASSRPGKYKLGPVDHADQLRDSWTAVYHKMRNHFRSLGVEWQYDKRVEPHPGDGENQCYPHEHIVLLIDSPDLQLSDLRPIVEEHVETCDAAGPVAHDLDVEDWDANREDVGTAEIRKPDEIDNLAAYVCDYASIEPADLLERELPYVAFAASMWAVNAQTISRSDAACRASTADACKQRFEHSQCDQDLDHGEEIRRKEIRQQRKLVCAECGSPHGIDQSQTLVEAKHGTDDGPTAVADGGRDWHEEREDSLRDRWPSADAAVAVGEQPTRTGREIRNPDDSDKGKAITDRDIRLLVRGLGEGVRRPEWMKDGWILEHDPRYRPDPDDPLVYSAWSRAPDLRDPLPRIVVFLQERYSLHPDRIAEFVHQERADYDPQEDMVSFRRPPAWRLDAITVHGERHSVDDGGGGVQLVETRLSGEALKDWIRRNTRILEMAADTCGQLLWKGSHTRVSDVVDRLAERAGASVDRCEHIIEAFVDVPHRPIPWWEPECWGCSDGEYEGDRETSTWECWNCGDQYPIQ